MRPLQGGARGGEGKRLVLAGWASCSTLVPRCQVLSGHELKQRQARSLQGRV